MSVKVQEKPEVVEAIGRRIELTPDMASKLPPSKQQDYVDLVSKFSEGPRSGMGPGTISVYLFALFTLILPKRLHVYGSDIEADEARDEDKRVYTLKEHADILLAGARIAGYLANQLTARAADGDESDNPNAEKDAKSSSRKRKATKPKVNNGEPSA